MKVQDRKKHDFFLKIRILQDTRRHIEMLANRLGMKPSTYCRTILLNHLYTMGYAPIPAKVLPDDPLTPILLQEVEVESVTPMDQINVPRDDLSIFDSEK